MFRTDREKLWLEEQMNLLLADEAVTAVRTRASGWVNGRLQRSLEARLREACAVTEAQWNGFLGGEEPDFSAVQKKIYAQTAVSRDEKRELRLLAKVDKGAAAERLLAYLLKKERTDFQKRAGITPAAWSRFLAGGSGTGDEVAAQIAAALSLNDEETAVFQRLILRDTFGVPPELKARVRELIEARGCSIDRFLWDAALSENAWEPFRANLKGLPTSRSTMLKLIIGLELDRPAGSRLWRLVDTDFALRRDLAVLIGIRNGIYDQTTLYYILEHFARGYGGERFYRNLYADPAEK